ncbi:hypothetical protein BaRGS_00009143 [Batillaria attramentaria]|uniref:Centromere protein P n=1 Tax=Batillaria attramentaria TaxID=370345 RepID=A0ABD0LJM8_9CAEN
MLAHMGAADMAADTGDAEAVGVGALGQDDGQLVKDLEAEIQLLERRLDQFRNRQQTVKNAASSPTLESVTAEIHQLEQLLKENEILSGLTISEASSSVLEQDMTTSLRQHSITGEAGGMQFKLQFDVREQLADVHEGEPRAEVVMLEMDVQDDMVTYLRSELFEIATDVSVRELFQLLSSYGMWVEDRERAINHFANTFPELAQREEQEDGCNVHLVIADPRQDLKLRVIWGLRMLPMKSVVPDLQLQVEASPEVLEKDSKGALANASPVFQLMCKKFGIESALHTLIKLMDETPP